MVCELSIQMVQPCGGGQGSIQFSAALCVVAVCREQVPSQAGKRLGSDALREVS